MLACGSGCAKPDWIQQTLVTVDMTGTWRSTEGGLFELALEQKGAEVTGSFLRQGLPQAQGGNTSGGIEGSVAGDAFRFKQTTGTFANLEGDMTLSGDEMSGKVTPSPAGAGARIILRRVSSSPRPASQA